MPFQDQQQSDKIWMCSKSWGYPPNHPVVMDDHEFQHVSAHGDLGIPYDLRNPLFIASNHHLTII